MPDVSHNSVTLLYFRIRVKVDCIMYGEQTSPYWQRGVPRGLLELLEVGVVV